MSSGQIISGQSRDVEAGCLCTGCRTGRFSRSRAAGVAQDAAATIAVDVKVVTLPVTVRDKHGAIVRDLTKTISRCRKTAGRRL